MSDPAFPRWRANLDALGQLALMPVSALITLASGLVIGPLALLLLLLTGQFLAASTVSRELPLVGLASAGLLLAVINCVIGVRTINSASLPATVWLVASSIVALFVSGVLT